jgi:hypothetical protein
MRTLLTIAALPLLSTACSRPSVVDLPPEDSPPGDSAPGDSRPSDIQPWDPDTEDLPGNDAAPWDTPALCSASIACEQTIPDEPKVPCELRLTSASGLVLYEGWAGF